MKAQVRLWTVAAVLFLSVACNAVQDHWFPRFHPRPKTDWINDPNGPMYYNGMYHLFTQYNPYGPDWGSMSWSHMVSYDLAFWFEMPVALLPDQPYDAFGVYSGSTTITPDGDVFIAYTCVDSNTTQRQCIAYPKDPTDKFLQEWVKYEGNPIIVDPPPAGNGQSFRDDTTAWMLDGKYVMAVGTSLNNTGAVWLYTSTDFKNWTSLGHSLYESADLGSMLECPDFYPVTEQGNPNENSTYALKVSTHYLDYYLLGKYDSTANKFTPNTPTYIYDHGKMYASKSFWDPVGKRQILWGWVPEDFDTSPAGWQGVISLPRAITYNSEFNMLFQTPIDNLKLLRISESAYSDSARLNSNTYWDCSAESDSWTSNQFEAEITMDFTDCYPFPCSAGVSFLASADGTQSTNVYISTGQPLGPFINQTLNVPGMQQIGNITLPKHSTRPVLIAKCEELCKETPECVSWLFVGNYSWDSSSTSVTSNLTSPPGPHSHRVVHAKGDSPASPFCFLYSGDDLAPESIFYPSQYCTDCASGMDYSDSVYPVLVVNRTYAGQGDSGAVVSPNFAVIPVNPSSPSTSFDVHLYVDHSISEVYVDNTAIIIIRTYPDESSNHWGVFTGNNQGSVTASVKAWKLLDATVFSD